MPFLVLRQKGHSCFGAVFRKTAPKQEVSKARSFLPLQKLLPSIFEIVKKLLLQMVFLH
ncbi:hypothetical protein FHS90_004230 [Rufibacter quisquiliarum]|uniref:Uncharacterized protein n=1 Tax=Rufibacter quisquiliarum TaxID=1549639 RepID=A0A839GKW6_9BACT|nr:hypothetical protein [Rufibacter quisquiliarum]